MCSMWWRRATSPSTMMMRMSWRESARAPALESWHCSDRFHFITHEQHCSRETSSLCKSQLRDLSNSFLYRGRCFRPHLRMLPHHDGMKLCKHLSTKHCPELSVYCYSAFGSSLNTINDTARVLYGAECKAGECTAQLDHPDMALILWYVCDHTCWLVQAF